MARRLLEDLALPLGPVEAKASPEAVLAEVRNTPVPRGLTPFPREAPHAAMYLRAQRGDLTRLRTTLDAGTQRLAERLLRDAAGELATHGIHNGAAVVVDHERGEVLALVGSFDFFDTRHGGQIPGFDTPRSPGSALKPFLYAMGIDRGLVLPEHLVADIPESYGGYVPHNFDGRFMGVVRMEYALSQSLNLPFVQPAALARRGALPGHAAAGRGEQPAARSRLLRAVRRRGRPRGDAAGAGRAVTWRSRRTAARARCSCWTRASPAPSPVSCSPRERPGSPGARWP